MKSARRAAATSETSGAAPPEGLSASRGVLGAPDPIPQAPAPAPAAPAPPGPATHRGAWAPFRHRDFSLFWWGALFSNAGNWLQNVALAWVVLEITDSAFWVSMVTFTQFFPTLLFGLAGGLVADRFERRRILLITQGAGMVVAFALAAITFGHHASVATVLPVVAVGGIAIAFNAPAFQAIIGDLIPRELLLDAISLNTAQFSGARVIGPLVGGVMLATLGAGWAFTVNGISFVTVLVALFLIRPVRHEAPASRGRRALLGGFRVMRASPVMRTTIAVVALQSLFAAPVLALLPVIAKKTLGLGAGGYGALFGAFSVGAVAGALLTGRLVRRLGVRTAIVAGIGLLASGVLVLAESTLVAISAPALVAIGFAYTFTVSTTNTTLQAVVPASKRGRVMSLYMMAWAGLYPVGSLLGGLTAQHLGVRVTLAGSAVVLAATATAVRLRGGALGAVGV